MILAIDTSTAACTAALFDKGHCIAEADERIGRGHAERLVPMIEALLGGRAAQEVLVGVGPGSFTGIRVGIAAAQGLAIGWDCSVQGMSSLALLAAGADEEAAVAAVVDGGHGELFVQQFDGRTLEPVSDLLNLPPAAAAAATAAALAIGPAAQRLVEARGWGEAVDALPSARHALRLPPALRSLPAKPVYARAPDARPRNAA